MFGCVDRLSADALADDLTGLRNDGGSVAPEQQTPE
jgi:hypothetical protein